MKEIKLKKEKVILFFKELNKEESFILKKIKQSFVKLKIFFNLPFFQIKIYLAYSRKEFEKFISRKSASWQVGHTNCPKNEIYLLSPSVFEEESIHKKEDFPKVLTHELTHLFTYKLYSSYEPRWLIEGLAYYIAGQGKVNLKKKIKLKLKNNFLSQIDTKKMWKKNLQNGAYQLSFLWTDFLIKKFGREKILELLRQINLPYKRVNFYSDFRKIYQYNLTYLQADFVKSVSYKNPKRREVRKSETRNKSWPRVGI